MATIRARPLPHPVRGCTNPVTPHIYRANGHWLVGFGPLTPLAQVNAAMRWVVKTQGQIASPARW